MTKLRKGIVEEIKKEKEFAESQEHLKNKYGIQEQEVVVVEKNNIYKFTVKTVIALIKWIASAILLALAAIGLMTLVYPVIRESFLQVLKDLYMQLQMLIPIL